MGARNLNQSRQCTQRKVRGKERQASVRTWDRGRLPDAAGRLAVQAEHHDYNNRSH
jgi:hypothetical protein